MKALLKYCSRALGYEVIRSAKIKQHELLEIEYSQFVEFAVSASGLNEGSRSQLRQDIFALLVTNFKRSGFFVEFGATNGVDLSNTYLLEKSYDWTGILAEPAPIWHNELAQNRKAIIDTDCVWSETGKTLEFDVVSEPELSTLRGFVASDHNADKRKGAVHHRVATVSLLDLLKRHNAPRHIDYLSIDTEGSEFQILSAFDFSDYEVSVISCEHNYTSARRSIYDLLTAKGYTRMFPTLSKWDDWYVKSDTTLIKAALGQMKCKS
ncbi:MAG: FkbM family methyltransferase [Verrucomicrobiota bacterium]